MERSLWQIGDEIHFWEPTDCDTEDETDDVDMKCKDPKRRKSADHHGINEHPHYNRAFARRQLGTHRVLSFSEFRKHLGQ
jgi:hypothetical protein